MTSLNLSILSYISSGKSIREIGRKLNKSHQAIQKHVKQLEEKGYISKQVRSSTVLYLINPMGNSVLQTYWNQKVATLENDPRTVKDKVATLEKDPNIQRLHATRFRIDLISQLPPNFTDTIMKFSDYPIKKGEIHEMKNWNQYAPKDLDFGNFFIIVNTRTVEIRGIQVEASMNIETNEMVFQAFKVFEPFLDDIEAKLRNRIPTLKFLRNGRGIISISFDKKEIAQVNDAFAKKYYGKERWIHLNEKGEPRWLIDHSTPSGPEIEAVNKHTVLNDNEALREFKEDITKEEYASLTHDIEKKDLGKLLDDLGDRKWNHREEQDKLSIAVTILTTMTQVFEKSREEWEYQRTVLQDQLSQIVAILAKQSGVN